MLPPKEGGAPPALPLALVRTAPAPAATPGRRWLVRRSPNWTSRTQEASAIEQPEDRSPPAVLSWPTPGNRHPARRHLRESPSYRHREQSDIDRRGMYARR